VKTQFRDLLRRKALRCFLTATILFAVFLNFAPVLADGGIAMSGGFYQQAFIMPQGSSISGPSIYVVVFNNGSEELQVRMTSQAPPGVSAILSHSDFTLPPGGQQEVLAVVEVAQDTAPGEYEISITAESYKEGVSGIQLTGAATQRATLEVVGESALVTLQAVSPEGQPVVAMVRLYRVAAGQSHEIDYSETGTLTAKVAPGSFIAASYMGGQKVAEESFTVAANDEKTVTLMGATVYFEGFGLVPNYYSKGGKLAFAQIVYTVRNLYQRVAEGEVILEVSRDEALLEEVSLATLSPLDVGQVGLNYNYIPAGGWIDGSYSFKLQLKLDGKPYAASLVEQLEVSGSGDDGGGISPAAVGGIAAGAVIVGIAGWLLVRSRKKGHE